MTSFRKMVLIPADQVLLQTGDGRSRNEQASSAFDGVDESTAKALLAAAQLKQAKKEVLEEPTLATAAQLALSMNKLMTENKPNGKKMSSSEKMRMLRVARNMYNRMLDATQAHRRQLLQTESAAETTAKTTAAPLPTPSHLVSAPPPPPTAVVPESTSHPSVSIAEAESSAFEPAKASPVIRTRKQRKKSKTKQLLHTPASSRDTVALVPSTPQKGKGGVGKKRVLNTNVPNANTFKRYCIYKY